MTPHDELMALAGDIEAEIKAARDVEAEIQRNLITLIGSPPNSMYPDLMERLTSSQRRRVVVGLWAMRIRALLDSDAFRAMVRDAALGRAYGRWYGAAQGYTDVIADAAHAAIVRDAAASGAGEVSGG